MTPTALPAYLWSPTCASPYHIPLPAFPTTTWRKKTPACPLPFVYQLLPIPLHTHLFPYYLLPTLPHLPTTLPTTPPPIPHPFPYLQTFLRQGGGGRQEMIPHYCLPACSPAVSTDLFPFSSQGRA